MDHGPEFSYQSGLEMDSRQDEASAKYPGREDDEFPTALDKSQASQDLPSHMPVTETRGRVCGLRVSTFSLLVTVIVLLALAGVGMGVLGSKIISEKKDVVGQNRGTALSNSSQSTTSNLAVFSSTASLARSLTTTSSITSSTTQLPVVETLPLPNNDCGAVQPQYTIQKARGKFANATFDISCDTVSSGGTFLSFYSPSVTTCIRACVLFNIYQTFTEVGRIAAAKNCSAIVYSPTFTVDGNCFLKQDGIPSVETRKANVTYARLRLNNGNSS